MDNATPQWSWPANFARERGHAKANAAEASQSSTSERQTENENHSKEQQHPQPQHKQRYWGPRICRICFDEVYPTFEEPSVMGGFMKSPPRPVYKSDDPACGRLISPCQCKGSQRFVHEGCLQQWRYADSTAKRNFFACPTCGYQYKLERLSWANRLSSAYAQILLTVLIFVFSIFLLGFIADPILNLWSDPMGTIADTVANVLDDIEAIHEPEPEEPATWLEHFLKGFFSLGLLGFFKTFLAMTPFQWWNLRSSGLLGSTGRRGGTGRARVESINIGLVIIGAVTFMWTVWKGVRKFCASALQRASDRVFDVGGDDDNDEDTKEY